MNTAPTGRTTSWWSGRGADALLIAIALAAIVYQLPRTLPGDHLLDFGSSLASGQAARQGLNPYGVYPLTFHFMSDGFQIANPNLSPPISAILYQAFGLAEPHLAFRVWYGITVALYAATIVLLVRGFRNVARLPLIICASALAGFWETLILGQIYVPLVLATVAAWLLLARRHDAWAGVLIGMVVALKPNFAVWPVLLLLSGYRKPALIALATAALLSAVPVVAFGPDVYRQWFTLLASDGWRAIFPTNAAFSGLAARLGVPPAGFAASLLLLAGSAAWALARHRSLQEVSALALLVSLLASPLAWIHYTLFLLPVICWTWNRPGMRLFLALIIVPVPIVVAQMSSGKVLQLTLGSLYNWALLLLLGIILAADRLAVALPRLLTRSEGATVSARWTDDAAA